jgi:8-oxo-dGTP pyrophosphatase MutT (NUDIX family)
MTPSAAPHPAATVALVRPAQDGGFEVLMNRRPEGMETYAGVYVFPGGRLEPDDSSERMRRLIRGLSSQQAQQILGGGLTPELSLAYWVAAARELFEEAGIHFFIDRSGRSGQVDLGQLLEKRDAVQRGQMGFSDLLESQGLHCDLRGFVYFFHRITPDHYRIRFDTRFFLAALPIRQTPLRLSEEVAESLWISPQQALARSQSGAFPMMPPTIAVLRTLAEHGSWRALSGAFQGLSDEPAARARS